jgi:hypothetical protein
MNLPLHNDLDRTATTMDAEQSLRLVASLPAPAGIEDRVKSGLRSAPRQTSTIPWPVSSPYGARWTQGAYIRGAAAAAIVVAVVGGGWGVHARFQPAPVPAAEVMPQRIDGGAGGLSAAGAVRKPKTVEVPVIAAPAQRKQGIGDGANDARVRANGIHHDGKRAKSSASVAAPAPR